MVQPGCSLRLPPGYRPLSSLPAEPVTAGPVPLPPVGQPGEAVHRHTAAALEWEGHPTLNIHFRAVCDAVHEARNGSDETMTDIAARQSFTRMDAQVGLFGSRWRRRQEMMDGGESQLSHELGDGMREYEPEILDLLPALSKSAPTLNASTMTTAKGPCLASCVVKWDHQMPGKEDTIQTMVNSYYPKTRYRYPTL